MTHLVVCLTCQKNSGADLYGLMMARGPAEGLKITGHDCLWSCAAACAVQIRAEGKYGYHLGGFRATEDHADALLDFAAKHHLSATGDVSYERWPEAIKGHFMARIPPLD